MMFFKKAEIGVKSIQDILNLGIYITTVIKSHLPILEAELALFPNLKVIMLMGDVDCRRYSAHDGIGTQLIFLYYNTVFLTGFSSVFCRGLTCFDRELPYKVCVIYKTCRTRNFVYCQTCVS